MADQGAPGAYLPLHEPAEAEQELGEACTPDCLTTVQHGLEPTVVGERLQVLVREWKAAVMRACMGHAVDSSGIESHVHALLGGCRKVQMRHRRPIRIGCR